MKQCERGTRNCRDGSGRGTGKPLVRGGIALLPDGGVSVHLGMMDCADAGIDCSQSKLSQQELADLQKATHFDKKELQQWYKGTCFLGTLKSRKGAQVG